MTLDRMQCPDNKQFSQWQLRQAMRSPVHHQMHVISSGKSTHHINALTPVSTLRIACLQSVQKHIPNTLGIITVSLIKTARVLAQKRIAVIIKAVIEITARIAAAQWHNIINIQTRKNNNYAHSRS